MREQRVDLARPTRSCTSLLRSRRRGGGAVARCWSSCLLRCGARLIYCRGSGGAGELKALRDAIDRMKRNRHLLEEFNREQALFVRSEFLAYVEAGFTRP